MENAGNVAVPVLLLTVIRMFDQVPVVGPVAPSRRPLYTENCAQLGLLTIEYRSVDWATAGSRAVGRKLYQELVPKLVLGVPVIVGAASATLLRNMKAQRKAKKIPDAPKAGTCIVEVRIKNPRGYDTGAAFATHAMQRSPTPAICRSA
jgi:hypothetical protein